MSATLGLGDWLATVEREYLRDFIPAGGTAVKFAVTPAPTLARRARDELRGLATEAGCQFAYLDAGRVKLHMVDQMFHEVARQLDWDALAADFMRRLLDRNGLLVPAEPERLTYRHIAELNGDEESLLRQHVRRLLIAEVYRDFAMGQEFRLAMLTLCQAQLDPGGRQQPEVVAVKEWLRGELRLLRAIKPVLIFQKIARHNARDMFVSLAHWLRRADRRGLVLVLDISRYLADRRAHPDALHHSPMAAMDAYEVLRQFIDATDELEGVFIAVLAPSEFLGDPRRGLERYEPLKMRIWDDVRDRNRVNPLSALVRLGGG